MCLSATFQISSVSKDSDSGLLTVSVGSPDDGAAPVEGVDCLLWAIGRTPNTSALDLDKAHVDTDDKGNIVADAQQNTSASQVRRKKENSTRGNEQNGTFSSYSACIKSGLRDKRTIPVF